MISFTLLLATVHRTTIIARKIYYLSFAAELGLSRETTALSAFVPSLVNQINWDNPVLDFNNANFGKVISKRPG